MTQRIKDLYERWKPTLKKIGWFIINPHFLICFGIGWMITNGWAYIMLGVGMLLNIRILKLISSGYLTFLWLPCTPEKIVTVAISCKLLKILFP